VRIVTGGDVHAMSVGGLGLDPSAVDLTAPEAVSALVRQTAALCAPCSRRALADSVFRCLRGLVEEEDLAADRIRTTIENLVAYGDVLELREGVDGPLLLHLAPPSFIARSSGAVFLVGIAPDVVSPLPTSLQARVDHTCYKRVLRSLPGEDLAQTLKQCGLVEVPERLWLKAPPLCPAQSLKADCDANLDRSGAVSSDVAGLKILDSGLPVRYYLGRWTEPRERSGRFIGRREQRYGASLWCYVELDCGSPSKLYDFTQGEWPGCDQAWHLQMALDACLSHRQQYRVGILDLRGSIVLSFFSPIPSWAQRHLDTVGERVEAPSCLFAYRLPVGEVPQEKEFLETRLWLAAATNDSSA